MKKPKGFTLIEVLLACAILAIGLTVAAMQFSKHLSVTRRMEESVLALRVAGIQMDEALDRLQRGGQDDGLITFLPVEKK